MGKPTLTSQLRDGQLEHTLHIAGEAFQRYSTRAAALCALALALELVRS